MTQGTNKIINVTGCMPIKHDDKKKVQYRAAGFVCAPTSSMLTKSSQQKRCAVLSCKMDRGHSPGGREADLYAVCGSHDVPVLIQVTRGIPHGVSVLTHDHRACM